MSNNDTIVVPADVQDGLRALAAHDQGTAQFAAPNAERIRAATAELLEALGLDTNSPGLRDTPSRVAKKWIEMLSGYAQNPATILARDFPADGYDEMIVLREIEFVSFCEHHLMPFRGEATVAYVPGPHGKVVGLSKLARLVDCYAQRLQIQERMTAQIARALVEHLSPRGVGVIVSAKHECLGCRGAKKASAKMLTSALHGEFKSDPTMRGEFLALSGVQR